MRNALTLGVYNHAECFQHVELFWLLKGISTSISSIILLSFSMEDLILIDELEWLNLSNLTLEYIAQKWIIMNFHREFQIISQNSQIISMSKQLRPGKKIVMALIIWNWKIHAGGRYSFFLFLVSMVTQPPFWCGLLIGGDSYGPNFDLLNFLDVKTDKGVV